jgi:DNA ligase-1
MAPGVPVKPMLARACSGPGDALRLLGRGALLAEHKYDGQRAQVHLLAGGAVAIFSRNCEDRTQVRGG